MILAKLKNTLRKVIPPSRFSFDCSEKALVRLIRDQREALLKEIRSLQSENRALCLEIARLREKDLAGLAEVMRQEIARLREKDLAGLAEIMRQEIAGLREKNLVEISERISLFRDQFDFYFKHFCKNDLAETIRKGTIPLRFYKNVDPEKRNWGDELNINLFEAISNGKVKVVRTSDKKSTDLNILAIGSTCSDLNWGSVIWGAGLISEDYRPLSHPIEVRAVRGPLTRKVLRAKGIDCPAVYGDPALLLPLFYQPASKRHHGVTVVPHYVDVDSEMVAKCREKEGFHVVDMRNYGDWRDVIDAIVNSDFVISSSLHGLVVAEAYGVPSLWVEFSDKILGNWFKYRDFYESIGKRGMKPVRIGGMQDFESLSEFKKQWQKGFIDLEPLLKSCPFPIVKSIAVRDK